VADILILIMAWWISFTIVVILILSLGFGPAGVVAGMTMDDMIATNAIAYISRGSLAAAFQAWMYGGFTPAAGIFATMTSLAMLGLLAPFAAIAGAMAATTITFVVWLCI
jgi:hypothetical protein